MKILISGGGGFIGKNITDHILLHLKSQDTLYVISSRNIRKHPLLVHIRLINNEILHDTFRQYNLKGLDFLIHLASFTPKNTSQINEISKNIDSITFTQSLLENLPEMPKKIIYTSTLDVYKDVEGKISEKTTISPQSIYASTKLYIESFMTAWAVNNKVILQILRIGHIFGPGEEEYNKLIPVTIKKLIRREQPIIYSKGEELRSYLYIDDCCKAIWNAMFIKTLKSTPINVVSSKSYSVLEIVKIICEISESQIRPKFLQKNLDVRNITFENSKMVQLLGNEKTELKKGLQVTWNYFKHKYG